MERGSREPALLGTRFHTFKRAWLPWGSVSSERNRAGPSHTCSELDRMGVDPSHARNNPINRVDPSGHADISAEGGCGNSVEECKERYVQGKAAAILKILGGRNDLEAMAQIVDTAASVYDCYGEMMPVLSGLFIGMEQSNPFTIYNAGMFNSGCAGLGRGPGDCPGNEGLGNHFLDTGFHRDFKDEHNQLYHFWAYVATTASTNWNIPYDKFVGMMVSKIANIRHKIFQSDDQATWADFYLGEVGIGIGLAIGTGLIPPDRLGDHLRNYLGPNASGSFGWVPRLVARIPLYGDR